MLFFGWFVSVGCIPNQLHYSPAESLNPSLRFFALPDASRRFLELRRLEYGIAHFAGVSIVNKPFKASARYNGSSSAAKFISGLLEDMRS